MADKVITFTSASPCDCCGTSDGALWSWGRNANGQLGLGDTTQRTSPVRIGTDLWLDFVANNVRASAIKLDGTLWSWGNNNAGRLGLGDTTQRISPVQVGTDTDWDKIFAGDNCTFAIKTDGTLWAWGNNSAGQLGLGDTTQRTSPVQVGTDTDWLSITNVSDSVTLANKTDGTLWAWGSGSDGQLGQGDNTAHHSPVQIGSATNWNIALTGDNINTLVTRTDGTLWAWGNNAFGTLGLGDTSSRNAPTQVGSGTNWALVTNDINSNGTALAIKTDGTLWAWGVNGNGQLGLGDTTQRNSPVQVGTGTNWLSVGIFGLSTFALKTDGTLWSWGFNGNGQLGLGNTTQRTSPVQVGTDTDWLSVSLSQNLTSAIKTDGSLWAWGLNNNGQLGLGDTTQRTSPVQVGTDTDWTGTMIANNFVIGIK